MRVKSTGSIWVLSLLALIQATTSGCSGKLTLSLRTVEGQQVSESGLSLAIFDEKANDISAQFPLGGSLSSLGDIDQGNFRFRIDGVDDSGGDLFGVSRLIDVGVSPKTELVLMAPPNEALASITNQPFSFLHWPHGPSLVMSDVTPSFVGLTVVRESFTIAAGQIQTAAANPDDFFVAVYVSVVNVDGNQRLRIAAFVRDDCALVNPPLADCGNKDDDVFDRIGLAIDVFGDDRGDPLPAAIVPDRDNGDTGTVSPGYALVFFPSVAATEDKNGVPVPGKIPLASVRPSMAASFEAQFGPRPTAPAAIAIPGGWFMGVDLNLSFLRRDLGAATNVTKSSTIGLAVFAIDMDPAPEPTVLRWPLGGVRSVPNITYPVPLPEELGKVSFFELD